MRIKLLIIFFSLLLGSCTLNKQVFISNNCEFPINSPYPGGVLNAEITNRKFNENEEIITEGLKSYICKYSFNNYKVFVPIPLDFKKTRIEIKQGNNFLNSIEVLKKNYRESRITISNEEYVSPSKDLLPRIREEYELSQKAKNTVSALKIKNWEMTIPVQGLMSSEFGVRRFINNEPRNRHSGMDIAAPEGTEVITSLSGEVIIASNFFYKGNVIYVNHGAGLVSSYSHLSKLEVKKGDKIKTGDIIGLVGQTGRVTGPHLHWEVYLMGVPINPEVFLATSNL